MSTRERDGLWDAGYKIPWHEPGFSRRMLREHLCQAHDLASRRTGWIDRQVAWIDGRLAGAPARVLDLGCGPGLYASRLAERGHTCLGIDFGPASIAYARRHNRWPSRCRFELGDLRTADLGGPHDLAMLLYGELNVFSPAETAELLANVRRCLAPAGRLIAEVQTADSVEAVGRAEPSVQRAEAGLFSDRPHTWRTTSRWLADRRVAVQTFEVTEDGCDAPVRYRSTTNAWTAEAVRDLFLRAGFARAAPAPTWPTDTDALVLWVADC